MQKITCPDCDSTSTAKILYGLFEMDDELEDELTKGEVSLGGCVVTDDDEDTHCNECGLDFNSYELDQSETIATKLIPKELLYAYEPKAEWLTHDSQLHGVDHMARVFILQELICDKLEAQGVRVYRDTTRWAAMAHDVGRVDDGVDLGHGRSSAEWIKENLADKMTPELLDAVTYIVHWHVPPDNEPPLMTTELKVLKDADALDRVRLGDLNESYLRTIAAKELVDVAKQLYEASMQSDRYEAQPFEAVLAAAQQLGLVEQ